MDTRISHDITMTDAPLGSLPLCLPREIRKEIYSYCSPATLGLFARTSKQYEAETISFRLLQAALLATPEFRDADQNPRAMLAIALLRKNPGLLFIKERVTDSYGRAILASPYQIFLGAGDVWALNQVHIYILPLIEDGETYAATQFKEQFPHYDEMLDAGHHEEARFYDDRNKQQIAEIVKQLAIIKQLIDADPFNNDQPLDTTQQAIKTLCQLFKPKPGEVIGSGLHFPLAILQEIYKTYNALPGGWRFFTLAVIKPALDALSTVDGQCCRDGLSELDREKGPNRRCHSSYQHPLGEPLSLTLVNNKSRGHAAVVDPHDGRVLFTSSTDPGYFDCFNKNAWAELWQKAALRRLWDVGLKNLCTTKAAYYRSYHGTEQRDLETLSRHT